MSQKLKFRVWDIERKRLSKPFEFGSYFIDWNDGDIAMPLVFGIGKGRLSLQQCTGLKDNNNIDIYEGDVLIISNEGGMVPDFIDEVWKKAESYIVKIERDKMGTYFGSNSETSYYDLLDYENWEVIGNIFENPELLKQ